MEISARRAWTIRLTKNCAGALAAHVKNWFTLSALGKSPKVSVSEAESSLRHNITKSASKIIILEFYFS